MVVVQFFWTNNSNIGLPTIKERPITTAFFPDKSPKVFSKSIMTPRGVQGTNWFWPECNLPIFSVWKPSTSLMGLMVLIITLSSMCFGRGSWTNMPLISGLLFKDSISLISSFWDKFSSKRYSLDVISQKLQALIFCLTYTWLAGLSPTKTTASEGFKFVLLKNCFDLSLTFALREVENVFTSMIWELIKLWLAWWWF